MLKTVKAEIDPDGAVQLLEPIQLARSRLALVTILDDEPPVHRDVLAILSESALGQDWNRPKEDEAWFYLRAS